MNSKLLKKGEQERTIRKKARFLGEFEKSLSIITISCARTGIGRQTYYDWINNDPVFRRKCEFICKMNAEYVEDKLLELIAKNHAGSIIFYLSRRGGRYTR